MSCHKATCYTCLSYIACLTIAKSSFKLHPDGFNAFANAAIYLKAPQTDYKSFCYRLCIISHLLGVYNHVIATPVVILFCCLHACFKART